jgi:hypothetical protein
MRENTRGYRRKTVNLHVELVSDVVKYREINSGFSTKTNNLLQSIICVL